MIVRTKAIFMLIFGVVVVVEYAPTKRLINKHILQLYIALQ